jgi:hypothetical protein
LKATRLALAVLLPALAAAPASAASTVPADRERFCGLVRACGLPEPTAWCAGVRGRESYEDRRCAEARRLEASGIDTGSALGYRLFQFLGHRHQIVYAISGEVRLSPSRLAFLVDDLPLAARLLSHFQKTRYTAEYLDGERRRFKGSRGSQLTTEAERILGSPASGRVEYFGHGVSQVGFWKLRGLALVQVDFTPAQGGQAVAYRVRVVSSPANAVVNAIMKLPLFSALVKKYIRETLEDITEAAQKLQRAGLAAGPTQWTPDEQRRLAAFLKLP